MLNISNSNTQHDHLIFSLVHWNTFSPLIFAISRFIGKKNTKDAFIHFFCHLSEPDKNEVMKYIQIIKLFHIKNTDIKIIGIGNIMVMSLFPIAFSILFSYPV